MNQNDIDVFFTRSNKDKNDFINKIRESIIVDLINNKIDYSKYTNKEKWGKIQTSLKNIIQEILNKKNITSNYSFNSKAGRNNNYDFELITDSEIIKIEFKTSPSMKDYPEVLSKYTKLDFINGMKYHEFFYDNHLQQLIDLVNIKFNINLPIIEKQIYIKECFGINSNKYVNNNYRFFELIEKLEYLNVDINDPKPDKNNRLIDSKYSKLKDEIVFKSISDYLLQVEENKQFNINNFILKLSEQGDKIFIFWDLEKEIFTIDTVDINNQIKAVSVFTRKNKNINTIIVKMDNNTQYECLLRWKNHKGVLGPAWQIKYVKS